MLKVDQIFKARENMVVYRAFRGRVLDGLDLLIIAAFHEAPEVDNNAYKHENGAYN